MAEPVAQRPDLWRDCAHPGVGPRDHRCKSCGGTLRRCCDSLVGAFPHIEGCQAKPKVKA